MKKSLILTSLLVGAISFSGCGSDSDSDGGGKDNPAPTPGNNTAVTVTPVTTKVVCDPDAITFEGGSYDVKYAAEGDVTVVCQEAGGMKYGEYQLVAGVQTLTIVDATKVENFAIDLTTAKGTATDTYDYKAGTINHKINGTFEGQVAKYDCTETYPSPLPTTLTDTTSIEELLDWYGDSNNRISSDCPQSYYSDFEGDTEQANKGTVEFIENYTLTDNNGKKHLITNTGEMIFK